MSKKLFGVISLLTVLGLAAAPTAFVLAADDITWSPQPPPDYDYDDFLDAVARVVNYLFGGVLVICVIFILLAAYIFITAGGSPEKVTLARQYLIYALIGLAVAVIVRGIINFMAHILGATIDGL